jgi:hypothetical protein
VFPKQLLLSLLPPEFDVLCTHPMFGPDSGKGSWEGLNFMYDAVRVGRDAKRQARVDNFLAFFRQQGCRCALKGGGCQWCAGCVCVWCARAVRVCVGRGGRGGIRRVCACMPAAGAVAQGDMVVSASWRDP